MVPYRARLFLRIARIILAASCLAWYAWVAAPRFSSIHAVLAAYLVFALGAMFESRFDSPFKAAMALIADAGFFGFWTWVTASVVPGWVAAGWLSAWICGYLLASAVLLHEMDRAFAAAAVAFALSMLLSRPGDAAPAWVACGTGTVAVVLSLYKRYLERRMSNTLRYNVMIRSQAQTAREAERQRIAADFHDGPLQSFISFQMRLEIVKKLMARDLDAAADELRQLQELCRSQVGELRGFVRSMRPADDGSSLPASLNRMVEQFQRDTGISATFSSGDLHDPAETEVSLELLQIVRETLNNVQKHSGATRIAISASIHDRRLEISAEDNGSGFPFSGSFNLDELELLRLGPMSVKRRVRMLGGELQLESRPGQGARMQIRVPV